MNNRRAILISNPNAGRDLAKRAYELARLRERLEDNRILVDLAETRAPGDATRIAQQAAADRFSDVIVSGGDGTINEALQGIVGSPARLSVFPSGTANVLARELRLPSRWQESADVIARGNTLRIHIGCATNETTGERRHFFLMAGIGLDALTVERVKPHWKRRFGKTAFWLSGFSHLFDWKPSRFEIEIDGHRFPATFAAIGKAPRYGGGLHITPGADPTKPEFEICVVSSKNRFRYLAMLPFAMIGGFHRDSGDIRYFHTTRARAVGDAPVQLDGELFGRTPMTFEVSPHSIEVITPAS